MKKKHLRVLKQIQDKVPPELLENLTHMVPQSPEVKRIFELALTKPDSEVSQRKKRAIRAMLDSGRLDREVEELDFEVEKKISDFYEKEIDLAVKLGRLPKSAPQLESLKNKGTQYARRQEKRLRAEFLGETDDVEPKKEDDQNNQGEHPSRTSNRSFVPPTVG